MADKQQGGETIREMIAGFNTMQQQLGILPMQSASMPMGVNFTPPPPPPPVMHPSEVSMMAVQHQQAAMQNTMQTAQMTRYQPPPSAPMGGGGGGMGGFGWGGTMSSNVAQQMNPYMASALGGGGGGGMANPMFMTSSNFGMYRPQSAGPQTGIGMQRLPPIFNPLAPQIPGANFMTPNMQNYQQMQGYQSWDAGIVASKTSLAMGMAGSIGGSVLGGMFGGPIGSIIGGWAGEQIGSGMGQFMTGPHMQDVRRGRQIQNMTAGYINAGAHVNPFTGQGMDRESAVSTARGLRKMSNDYDFSRTGFNTADVMKITQLSSDQGLLATAQSPDEILRRVKDISKSVKVLMQITGDPDVRSVISSLGQMRNLGFSGLEAQGGAVANRVAFARMAGVSQGAMGQNYGMPGAMAAQQQGLVGATGYMAGMSGAAVGNMAIGAGAFSDLQLARGGGRSGISQTAMLAQLGAINQDIYLAAAVKRGDDGRLGVSADDYKRAQGLDIKAVANEAAANLRAIGEKGAFELATRKQEFKDQLAQQMSPFELQLNAFKQVRGIQKQVGHGITSGAAARMAGMDEDQARSIELMMESPGTYDAMTDGLQQSKRNLRDRERARREQNRTPGLFTRMGQATRSGLAGLSDWASSGPRSWEESFARVEEDRSAWRQGDRLVSHDTWQLARAGNANDERAIRRGFGYDVMQGPSEKFEDSGSMMNRFGQAIGFSAYNRSNRIRRLANETYGSTGGFHTSFGDLSDAETRLNDVRAAGRQTVRGRDMSATQASDSYKQLQAAAEAAGLKGFDAHSFVAKSAGIMQSRFETAQGMTLNVGHMFGLGNDFNTGTQNATIFGHSRGAFGMADSRVAMNEALGGGQDGAAMGRFMNKAGDLGKALTDRRTYFFGNKAQREVLDAGMEAVDKSASVSGVTDPAAARGAASALRKGAGWESLDSGTLTDVSRVLIDNDPLVVELLAANLAWTQGATEEERNLGKAAYDSVKSRAGDRWGEINSKAEQLGDGMKDNPKVTDAFKRIVSSAKGRKGIHTAVLGLTASAEIELAAGAQTGLMERMSTILPGVELGSNFMEAAKKFGEEAKRDPSLMKSLTPAQRAAVTAGMSGDKAKTAEAMGKLGATNKAALESSSLGTSAEAAINAQIEEIGVLSADVKRESKGGNKVERLFATSVEVFASAAKDFKEGAEHQRLNRQNPAVTSGLNLDD